MEKETVEKISSLVDEIQKAKCNNRDCVIITYANKQNGKSALSVKGQIRMLRAMLIYFMIYDEDVKNLLISAVYAVKHKDKYSHE